MALRPTQDARERLRRGTPPPVFRLDDPAQDALPIPRSARSTLGRLLVLLLALVLLGVIGQMIRVFVQSRLQSPVIVRDLTANSSGTIESGATKYRVTLGSVVAGQTAMSLPPLADGRTYVVAQVAIENIGNVSIAPGAWTLHMTDDLDRFPLVMSGAGDVNAPIAPGQTMTRTLVFDVPTTNGQKVKWLYYKDGTSPQAIEFATSATP